MCVLCIWVLRSGLLLGPGAHTLLTLFASLPMDSPWAPFCFAGSVSLSLQNEYSKRPVWRIISLAEPSQEQSR